MLMHCPSGFPVAYSKAATLTAVTCAAAEAVLLEVPATP
eukprot:CAMPEP_0172742380 /NCGR_PEP_ID=MMETSP1074-20121228/129398_1 /TAXON_ID=2916 /ORGANISM="Ceratium fusus, Strain PA161109" /LENGTH=38 /DNA_ID= /DNA_START= /DNA_END= /DNA_ORIENTATION=